MKQPSRCVMGLGLLCAVLLAANVGQLIHHASRPADNGQRGRLRNLTQDCLGLSKDCVEIAKQSKDKMVRTAVQAKDLPCRPGWTKFGKSCYVVSNEKTNWKASRAACVAEGAHLVFIDSRDEQMFVSGFLSSYNTVWIGLTDDVKEGTWTWADGTPVNATFWRAGNPRNYSEDADCGVMVYYYPRGSNWSDKNCFSELLFICEK